MIGIPLNQGVIVKNWKQILSQANRIGNDRISPPVLQNQRPIFALIRMMGLWKGDEVFRLNKYDLNPILSNEIYPFFQGITHYS